MQDGTVSEWLCSFEVCGHLLLPELNKQARSLVLGCGNSEFTEHLHNAGMSHTVNIDISQVVIDHMRAKHADCKVTRDLPRVMQLSARFIGHVLGNRRCDVHVL